MVTGGHTFSLRGFAEFRMDRGLVEAKAGLDDHKFAEYKFSDEESRLPGMTVRVLDIGGRLSLTEAASLGLYYTAQIFPAQSYLSGFTQSQVAGSVRFGF